MASAGAWQVIRMPHPRWMKQRDGKNPSCRIASEMWPGVRENSIGSKVRPDTGKNSPGFSGHRRQNRSLPCQYRRNGMGIPVMGARCLFTCPAVCSLSPASRDGAGLGGYRGRCSARFRAPGCADDAGVTRVGAGDGAAGAPRYGLQRGAGPPRDRVCCPGFRPAEPGAGEIFSHGRAHVHGVLS